MQYVSFAKVQNGLRIVLNDEGREYLADLDDEKRGRDLTFYDLIEHQICNGWGWVFPQEICALTDAPIISDDITRDEFSGRLIGCGRVYAYTDYAVKSPAAELYASGEIFLPAFD